MGWNGCGEDTSPAQKSEAFERGPKVIRLSRRQSKATEERHPLSGKSAAHAEDHVVSDNHGAPSTYPEGVQSDHLSDTGGSDLDVRYITQVGELAKVSREAWVGGQSTYVRQKLAIRHEVPSAG